MIQTHSHYWSWIKGSWNWKEPNFMSPTPLFLKYSTITNDNHIILASFSIFYVCNTYLAMISRKAGTSSVFDYRLSVHLGAYAWLESRHLWCKWMTCARICSSWSCMYLIPLNHQKHPWSMLPYPFCRWGNKDQEKPHNVFRLLVCC